MTAVDDAFVPGDREPTTPAADRRARQEGPPLVVLATISGALLLAGYLVTGLGAHAFSFSPGSGVASVVSELRHRDALRIGAVLSFASAVPLGIYAATASVRLRNLGIRAPGGTIALLGGLLAAALLMVGSLATWVLSEPLASVSPALVRVVQDLSLVAVGPGRLVGLGLLLAGIAVPAAFVKLLSPTVIVTGLALALLDELSTFALFSDLPSGLSVALMILGFACLAWLVAAGALLPLTRRTIKQALPDDWPSDSRRTEQEPRNRGSR